MKDPDRKNQPIYNDAHRLVMRLAQAFNRSQTEVASAAITYLSQMPEFAQRDIIAGTPYETVQERLAVEAAKRPLSQTDPKETFEKVRAAARGGKNRA